MSEKQSKDFNPQEVLYPDEKLLKSCIQRLSSLPPLIFAAEARTLKSHIAAAGRGEAFILQGGDCAESFAYFSADKIRDDLKLLLQMSVVLAYESGKQIIKIGRFAGQFAKPRSSLFESKGSLTLPSFRGDIINDISFDAKSRTPDPKRMLKAYFQSAATLNLLRAFLSGGLANLDELLNLSLDFTSLKEHKRFEKICKQITKSLGFMRACAINTKAQQSIYTSHEALLLPYEEALTRVDSISGKLYDCSAHMLWLGERTKSPNGKHAHFLSKIQNPLGIKIGPATKPQDILDLAKILNPRNEEGKLSLIFRLGVGQISLVLPKMLEIFSKSKLFFTYICDPMHGNTKTIMGVKTREFEDILGESKLFFKHCKAAGVVAGGLHLEMSGSSVTECLGGEQGIKQADLSSCFTSLCDPRLNSSQALEFAFSIAGCID